MRIDLERKVINHYESLQLEERTDVNLLIEAPGLEATEEVLLDENEMNYSQLRELQRRKSAFDLKKSEMSLAQKGQKGSRELTQLSDEIENEQAV